MFFVVKDSYLCCKIRISFICLKSPKILLGTVKRYSKSIIMGGGGGCKGIFVTRDKCYLPVMIPDLRKYNTVIGIRMCSVNRGDLKSWL